MRRSRTPARVLGAAAALLALCAAGARAWEPDPFMKDLLEKEARDPESAARMAALECSMGDERSIQQGFWLTERSLSLHPDHPALLESRAACLLKQGKKRQARREWEKAMKAYGAWLEKKPEGHLFLLSPDACGKMGINSRRAPPELGLWYAERAIAERSDYPAFYKDRADCLLLLGKPSEARRDQEKAIALYEKRLGDPAGSYSGFHTSFYENSLEAEALAGLYEQLGKCDKALAVYARLEMDLAAAPAADEHARGHKLGALETIKAGRRRCAPKE